MARELVGSAEVTQMLGVSRKRAWELTRRDDFPAPIAELIMGAVWELADVEQWAQRVGRTLHPLADPADTDA